MKRAFLIIGFLAITVFCFSQSAKSPSATTDQEEKTFIGKWLVVNDGSGFFQFFSGRKFLLRFGNQIALYNYKIEKYEGAYKLILSLPNFEQKIIETSPRDDIEQLFLFVDILDQNTLFVILGEERSSEWTANLPNGLLLERSK